MTEQADRLRERDYQMEQSYFCAICAYPLSVPDPEYARNWFCENPNCPACDESVLEEAE